MLNLEEFQQQAQRHLTQSAYDYYASGAHDQLTLARNRAAFEDLCLFYRVLVDVSQRHCRTELLGHHLSLPVLAAPTAFHSMACPEGEVATARACRRSGTLMILSTLSNRPMEEVAEACEGEFWFQLYAYKDRGATRDLVARAKQAGAKALVLTVDAPLLGHREADVRNRFQLPEGLSVVNLTAAGLADLPDLGGSGLAAYFQQLIDCRLTWKDLEWLNDISGLPILVKGVVRADDARCAVEHGASGLVVSNHGGRQLDTSPATIEALPAVAEAVDRRVPVLLDGGIRRGTDIVKALALGAQAVLIGRPVLWGLACDGQAGVERVFSLFAAELDLAQALCGTPTLADIDRSLVEGNC